MKIILNTLAYQKDPSNVFESNDQSLYTSFQLGKLSKAKWSEKQKTPKTKNNNFKTCASPAPNPLGKRSLIMYLIDAVSLSWLANKNMNK